MNRHFFNRLTMGIVLIALGVLFILHQADYIDLNIGYIFSTYWPVFIIYYCLKGLLFEKNTSGFHGTKVWNLFGLCIGLYFLARNLDYIDLQFGELITYAIPFLLILFGLSIIFKPRKEKCNPNSDVEWEPSNPEILPSSSSSSSSSSQSESSDSGYSYKYEYDYKYDTPKSNKTDKNTLNKNSFIGDVHLGEDFWELQPINISHFIGDTVLDLTKAQIPYGETKIVISAFIGDVKIFVPNDIELEISVTFASFLGDGHVFHRKEGGMFSNMKIESSDYQLAEKRIQIVSNMFIGDLKVQRIG